MRAAHERLALLPHKVALAIAEPIGGDSVEPFEQPRKQLLMHRLAASRPRLILCQRLCGAIDGCEHRLERS